jgi:signal recognition particle GTPase
MRGEPPDRLRARLAGLEEVLITADVGVNVTRRLLDKVGLAPTNSAMSSNCVRSWAKCGCTPGVVHSQQIRIPW